MDPQFTFARIAFYLFGFFSLIVTPAIFLIKKRDSSVFFRSLAISMALIFVGLFFYLSTSRLTSNSPTEFTPPTDESELAE